MKKGRPHTRVILCPFSDFRLSSSHTFAVHPSLRIFLHLRKQKNKNQSLIKKIMFILKLQIIIFLLYLKVQCNLFILTIAFLILNVF